jgi:hypothetical protein
MLLKENFIHLYENPNTFLEWIPYIAIKDIPSFNLPAVDNILIGSTNPWDWTPLAELKTFQMLWTNLMFS